MNRPRSRSVIFLVVAVALAFVCAQAPALAATRGFAIKAKTPAGAEKEIRLYTAYHALVIGCGEYRQG